jgi:hypothetical protein
MQSSAWNDFLPEDILDYTKYDIYLTVWILFLQINHSQADGDFVVFTLK